MEAAHSKVVRKLESFIDEERDVLCCKKRCDAIRLGEYVMILVRGRLLRHHLHVEPKSLLEIIRSLRCLTSLSEGVWCNRSRHHNKGTFLKFFRQVEAMIAGIECPHLSDFESRKRKRELSI